MQLEWILSPLTLYGLAALVMIASLALFIATRIEIAKVRYAFAKKLDSATASASAMAAELAALRDQIGNRETMRPAAVETRAAAVTPGAAQTAPAPQNGLSATAIIAPQRPPRDEIELLLKVKRLAKETALAPVSAR